MRIKINGKPMILVHKSPDGDTMVLSDGWCQYVMHERCNLEVGTGWLVHGVVEDGLTPGTKILRDGYLIQAIYREDI